MPIQISDEFIRLWDLNNPTGIRIEAIGGPKDNLLYVLQDSHQLKFHQLNMNNYHKLYPISNPLDSLMEHINQ